ncbi:hypothetical protein BFR04_08525 [Gaetbulibacter sp. 4G1]|nr:glycosyltransferase [Gaetbulibacter sp. 4G1]PIA77477.1 hypothetical protein BFR04_08525 [Gaetbulibacter sp. 4G1]
MKLSVLIPLYNEEPYIERCLNSLAMHNIDENTYEIIIINHANPLTSFIGDKYYQRKFKIFPFIFNSNILFYSLLYPLRLLNKFNLITLIFSL